MWLVICIVIVILFICLPNNLRNSFIMVQIVLYYLNRTKYCHCIVNFFALLLVLTDIIEI